MKNTKRVISIILAVTMCISVFSLPVWAGIFDKKEEEQKQPLEILTIFVEGINCGDIVDAKTGERLFPPSTDSIVSAVAKALPDTIAGEIQNDDEKIVESLVNGITEVFDRCSMDENGNSKPGVKFDYQWPSIRDIKKTVKAGEENHRITYCYDWRLDMKTTAAGLHKYIEYVMQASGVKKINLVGFSMGAAAVMSYLKLYEDEYKDYINGVVLLAAGCNGSSACGQPFSRKVNVDKSALINYVDSMLGFDLGAIIESSLIHKLGALSVTEGVIDWVDGVLDKYLDDVYDGMFMNTFGTMPGLWSLVPEEDYALARQNVPQDANDEFVEKIDWYHNQVALNKNRIIDGVIDNGLRFGILVKYGFPITPVTENSAVLSDGVIDTRYESFGATCADIGSTLGKDYVQKNDNGHNCLSADGLIDSSTCDYCDRTWFFKNCEHSSGLDAAMELFTHIFYDETQPTVWDGDYPQFLIIKENKPVALTENNYVNYYSDTTADENSGLFQACRC
ncbi:MAG: alpha/beta hydrolase [Clostridia bacterium]|nr:alpha/beta hydrolase [Clostridia bacterium]